jgi:hypothetical protein
VKTTSAMTLGDHISPGDLLEANGGIAVVMKIIPPGFLGLGQVTDYVKLLQEDGSILVTRLEYTTWRIINAVR